MTLPLLFRPIFEGKIGQALSELVKAAVSDRGALKLVPTCSYSGGEEHGKSRSFPNVVTSKGCC